MGFSTKAALRYHSLKHSNDKLFKCDAPECGKSFLTLGQLKQHEKGKCHCARAFILEDHNNFSSILKKDSSTQLFFPSNDQSSLTVLKSGPMSTAYSDDGSEPGTLKKIKMFFDESIYQ